MRRLLLFLFAVLLLPGAMAQQQVEIDTGPDADSRLELRNYTLPDGTEVSFYVLKGDPLTITTNGQTLTARHVELDMSTRELRVIGPGRLEGDTETVEGTDLVVSLGDETFSARDVLVITGALDVLGSEAYRVPGQISFVDGSFSPCSRCGQKVEDYGFRAERLEIYPGDRLVAHSVTMLVRGHGVLFLPIMVVPLAPKERQPQLLIEQGTATERARVALDWPYVSSPRAYGSFSIRWYADVLPGGGGLAGRLLGGSIEEHYLGGGINHWFHTDTGSGTFRLRYRPPFLDAEQPGGREKPFFNWRLHWKTDAERPREGEPQAEVLVERDDGRRYGMVEYRTVLTRHAAGLESELFSQGFFDLTGETPARPPSFAGRSTPQRTHFRLRFRPVDSKPVTLGVLRLSGLLLEAGLYEDLPNPLMRTGVGSGPLFGAARAHVANTVDLEPLDFWAGFRVEGRSRFSGWYYSSGQRLVDWDTNVTATQRFRDSGRLSVTFSRNTTEGETPFRFDQRPLRERTETTFDLQVGPWEWVQLDVKTGYVFRDSRNPRAEGFEPLETRLTLLGHLSWLEIVLGNTRNLKTGDPGNAEVSVNLKQSGRDFDARFSATYRHDLDPGFSADGSEPVDESATRFEGSLRLEKLETSFKAGFNFAPEPPADEEEPLPFWEPFEFSVTLGSLRRNDDDPGLRVQWKRDLNAHELTAFSWETRFPVGPLEVAAQQQYRLPAGGIGRSSLSVTWPGRLKFEAAGMHLVPPALLFVKDDPEQVRTHSYLLADAPEFGPQLWQVRYRTTLDPLMTLPDGSQGGRRDSTLELRVVLEDRPAGSNTFTVDLFVDLPVRDDRLPGSYLRRANLRFGADLGTRVGVQGVLGYRGTYSVADEELTRGELTLTNVGVTVEVVDDLYVGAMVNDVWDLSGKSDSLAAFNLQPEFMVVWNRCCWALYGTWNSAAGNVKIGLTTPGADKGLLEEISTPWRLPGRHPDWMPGS